MRQKTISLRFYETYEIASLIEVCVKNLRFFYELSWSDPTVVRCLYKFSKTTLLHHYIYTILAFETRYEYRKNADMYLIEDVKAHSKVFESYGIPLRSFKSFKKEVLSELGDNYDEYDVFYQWFLYQEDKFELLWEKITEEVFHLLFANRTFLLSFNQSLAEYLSNSLNKRGVIKNEKLGEFFIDKPIIEKPIVIPPEHLNKRGVIKRQSYIPSWVKKAVYYRDHGRCVLCQVDLSGLLSTDRKLHYDHIVPLNLYGVNDPCNVQLLCEACNLTKSGKTSKTGIKYPVWW